MATQRIWPHANVNHARAEHGYLEALLDETKRALQPSANPEQAQRAVAHFVEALTKHLEHEEKIYFPPLRALRPEHKLALKNFQLTHAQLRSQMQAVHSFLHDGALLEAGQAFEQLSAAFKAHEVEEEKLFRVLSLETQNL